MRKGDGGIFLRSVQLFLGDVSIFYCTDFSHSVGVMPDSRRNMVISAESRQLKFFSREELKDIEVVITHSDIVEDWFVNR